jgi:hypothetical protein
LRQNPKSHGSSEQRGAPAAGIHEECLEMAQMHQRNAKPAKRQVSQLPSHSELKRFALGFIADGASYHPLELRDTLAYEFKLTPDQLSLRFTKSGNLVIDNYIAHVLKGFTEAGYHIRRSDGRYHVTELGKQVARLSFPIGIHTNEEVEEF